jgi:hypothetical protein
LKKKTSLLIIILLSAFLVACNSGDKNVESKVKVTFKGTIEEIYEKSATVLVTEAEGKISGLVNINLTVNPDEVFQVGDKVKVGYDGTTMESSPLQIETLTLEKVE